MIVYREAQQAQTTASKLARVQQLIRDGAALEGLIEWGELEQGVIDAMHPEQDGWGPLEDALRTTVIGAAAAWLESTELSTSLMPGGTVLRSPDADVRAYSPEASIRAVVRLERLLEREGPRMIAVRPPEGFVHYALDPAGYASAVSHYMDDVGPHHAARAVVIGIRSIGTTLAAIVAAAAGTSRSATVRPRGGRGGRHVVVDADLEARIRSWLDAGGDLLLVDEGPGATGETFASVGAWLMDLGVHLDRIILFPSDIGHLPLAPPSRRAWFRSTRRYMPPDAGSGRLAPLCSSLGLEDLEDFGQGRWRGAVPDAERLPARPVHERAKYRARLRSGQHVLLRFTGLGRWGAEAIERATALEAAGVGPPILAAKGGFIACRWVEGRPLRPRSATSSPANLDASLEPRDAPALADVSRQQGPPELPALLRYLCVRARILSLATPVDTAPIHQMFLENTLEALGPGPPGLWQALRRLEELPQREAAIPDARLPLYEWVCTGDAHIKVDTLDHGQAIRLPGPTDRAWDVAGAIVEYALGESFAARLVNECAAASRDPLLAHAVRAYLPAYAAFRFAESRLDALEAWSEADRHTYLDDAERFRRLLARLLAEP